MTNPFVRYRRLVQQAQVAGRIPALSVALHRADRPLWTYQINASKQTRFRIGSVTKTFTAVLVMQCRDEGLLDLDDPLDRHLDLPEPARAAHGELPVRRLLSHTSGLQREPYGDVWDTLDLPDRDRLVTELARAERVLSPARRYHYSNLSFALLGHLVAQLRGGTWAEVLDERVLQPLSLHSLAVQPTEPVATGYLVDAYSDHARPEPPVDLGALGPAAQLWGTAADLARWAAFLADPARLDPDARVLHPATLDEMRWPLTPTEETHWGIGLGLGLIMVDQGDRVIHIGHDGAMPGFLASVFGRRGRGAPPACGVAVLGASGTALPTLDLSHDLLAATGDADPADLDPWVPGLPAPAHLASVLGRWWGEGFEYVFSWRNGNLQARSVDAPAARPPAVFTELGPDLLRTRSGREVGELLRLTRDPATGEVVRMHWATYRFTRQQETFA
jgi:CubicO group peptidase (beta-lactamase class C family)